MNRRLVRTGASLLAVLLTLSCLGPLFAPGGGWVGPAIAAALVATACGSLGRALPLSSVTGTVLVILGGVGLLTAVGTSDLAHLGFIPSGDSLSELGTLISNGFSDIRSYSPPVAVSPGLAVVVAGGVYAVAVVVDLFAVGADQPALAGIPLLGLVAVPAAFRPHGLGILHLVLALLGWLLLLALDGRDRLVRWGRPLGRTGSSSSPILIGGAAGRVAFSGLVAAFVLPLLIPALHGGIIHPPSTCCDGGSVRVVPPLTTMSEQLHQSTPTNLLTLTTDQPPEYLRFTALDNYSPNGEFTLVQSDAVPGEIDGPINTPTPGLGSDIQTIDVNDEISVLPTLKENYLPLPYSPVDVRISGNWKLTPGIRTVFSTKDTTAGQTFSVESQVPDPTKDQLRADPSGYDQTKTGADLATQLAPDLQLNGVPAQVGQLAKQLTSGQTTAYDKLFALQEWFTGKSGGFTYTLNPKPALSSGGQGILQFLHYKQGFCQQFATVFTLMARSLGLPARVAVGFTPGKQQPDGSYLVDSTDAHAWPEVWFTGVGWVRFEPTPRRDIGGETPSYLSKTAPGDAHTSPTPTASSVPSSTATTPPAKTPSKLADETPTKKGSATLSKPASKTPWIVVVVVLVVLLLLSLPALVRALRRRRRERFARGAADGPAGAHAMWEELLDTAQDVGWVLSPSETPRATGRRLAGMLRGHLSGGGELVGSEQGSAGVAVLARPEEVGTAPDGVAQGRADVDAAVQALGRLTRAEERARYAPPGSPSADGSALVDDARTVRSALLETAPAGTRFRARLLPSSLVASAARSARGLGRGYGRASTAAKAPLRKLGRRG